MLKNIIAACSLLVILLCGCTKKEYRHIDMAGDLKVHIYPYDEFWGAIENKANFKVTIHGVGSEISILTNKNGDAVASNLPLGLYTVEVSKDSFGTLVEKNVRLIGGSGPDLLATYISQQSTIKIKSYNVKISRDTVELSGVITHKYKEHGALSYSDSWPRLVAVFSDTHDVSFKNYKEMYPFIASENDTLFDIKLTRSSWFFQQLDKGTTTYVVLYGIPPSAYPMYDLETGKSYYENAGVPSEVKSFIMP